MGTGQCEGQLEVLDVPQCRRLLTTASIGRIAFTEAALPAIQPARFEVSGQDVLIPTGLVSKIAAGSRGAVLASRSTTTTWSSALGGTSRSSTPSRLISDPGQVRVLDAFGVRPWPPTPTSTHCYIPLRMAVIRGRRILSTNPLVDPERAREAVSTAHDSTPTPARRPYVVDLTNP
jgi:uncharacterized protein